MFNKALGSTAIVIATAALLMCACDDDKNASGAAPATSKPAATAVPAPPPTPKPTASAVPVKMRDDCPEGSSGPGTYGKPCEGKGTTRLMEVTWTGKLGDNGPSFRVVNTSKIPILFGKVAVYFYDKAGKQLADTGGKMKPHVCSGNIFDGPMKPAEKAVITFSCVKKSDVPDGATAIEAEMETVGFTDEEAKKNDFYWTNKDSRSGHPSEEQGQEALRGRARIARPRSERSE